MLTGDFARRVRRLHAAGYSQRDMAERLGCCQRTACTWLRRLGLAAVGYASGRSRRRRSEAGRVAAALRKLRRRPAADLS